MPLVMAGPGAVLVASPPRRPSQAVPDSHPGSYSAMDGEGSERVDGLALSGFLFRFVHAWAKQEGGGTEGAAEVMAGALPPVPPGTVELIEDMIDSGELPVPSQDTMGEWLEICSAARRGEFTVSHAEPVRLAPMRGGTPGRAG